MGNDTESIKVRIIKIIKNRKFWLPAIGVFVGGTLGFLYYFYVGCNSGTCPITSSPWGSIAAGSLIGFILTVK